MDKEELLELLAKLTTYKKYYKGSSLMTEQVERAEEVIDDILKLLYNY